MILNLFCCASIAQTAGDKLENELQKLYSNSQLPGFAVGVVSENEVLFKKSYGYEDIEAKRKFSTNRRFSVASISKTFIGLGLMQLVETGKLTLDTPVNDLLPFKVYNPYHPEVEITVEQLARHTSSLGYGALERKAWYLDQPLSLMKKDLNKDIYKLLNAWSENSSMDLGEFLKKSLNTDGEYYAKSNFAKNKPGEVYQYSNLGAALAGYIIELKTGTPYRDFAENLITEDLGLDKGIWRTTKTEPIPTSYFQNKIPTPLHFPIIYPTGGMMLSCDDLTQYLKEMIRGFNGNSQLLSSGSFQLMMNPSDASNPKGGVFWELNDEKVGHNGGNYGVTCFMSFDKNTGIGKVFMTNISSYLDDSLLKEMIGVWRKLAEYESKFD